MIFSVSGGFVTLEWVKGVSLCTILFSTLLRIGLILLYSTESYLGCISCFVVLLAPRVVSDVLTPSYCWRRQC